MESPDLGELLAQHCPNLLYLCAQSESILTPWLQALGVMGHGLPRFRLFGPWQWVLKEELKAGPRSSAGLEKLMQSCQSLGIEQLDMKEEVRSFQTKRLAHILFGNADSLLECGGALFQEGACLKFSLRKLDKLALSYVQGDCCSACLGLALVFSVARAVGLRVD